MKDFIYQSNSEKVVFGTGKRMEAAKELGDEFGSRIMIITTKGRMNAGLEIADLLGDKCIGIHANAKQHVPIESVEELLQVLESKKADSLLSLGGGSAIGLAKAAALRIPLPIASIPTTYSGSEMTPVWGITEDGIKTTGKNDIVKPKLVIYDPELTQGMSPYLSLTSGINAMAHAVEALYAEKWDPITALLAEEALRSLYHSLGTIINDPGNMDARSLALYGSWLSGKVLGKVNMALHHKLCHVLGGRGLPHAETHTVILPHVLSYQSNYVPEAMKAMARALGNIGVVEVVPALYAFIKQHNGPASLKELKMNEGDIKPVVDLVLNQKIYNPRPMIKEELESLVWNAYHGVL